MADANLLRCDVVDNAISQTCKRCLTERPIDKFGPQPRNKNGRSGTCRECENKRHAAARITRDRSAEYEASRERRRIPADVKARRAAEREEAKTAARAERAAQRANEKAERERQRAALLAEKPWLDSSLSPGERHSLRYRLDREWNLYERHRARIRKAQRGGSIGTQIRDAVFRATSRPKLEALLGYTMQELHDHIERQFVDGMNWSRFIRGHIHIDHIKPCRLFDLSTEDGLKACWALENLQPLWAEDNMRKAANYDGDDKIAA